MRSRPWTIAVRRCCPRCGPTCADRCPIGEARGAHEEGQSAVVGRDGCPFRGRQELVPETFHQRLVGVDKGNRPNPRVECWIPVRVLIVACLLYTSPSPRD